METARPFAPETRSRDRLWFGFRPDSRSDRGGPPAFRPARPSADQGRGPPDRLVGTEAAARVSCGEPITAFRTANSPTETFRIWPHRIRLRLLSPVRFPAKRGAECRGFSEPTARRRSQGDCLAQPASPGVAAFSHCVQERRAFPPHSGAETEPKTVPAGVSGAKSA